MPRKKRSSEKPKESSSNVEEQLVRNLVALQRVNTDLAEKFDRLTKEISSLLKLFETAGKKFASQPEQQRNPNDKDFLNKIDKLLDQNKILAKGMTLMEERIRSNANPNVPESQQEKMEYSSSVLGKPLPKF